MGKSGHVGRKMAATFASTGTPAFFMHPGEAFHGDLGMVTENDVVIAISNSGESTEVVNILPIIRRIGATIVAIPRAIFMGNSGGAFDNAKKYIESGAIAGSEKGSPAHKAAVTGDTVGDTRKDVVGVALDIFIKTMSTVANSMATVFMHIRVFK